MSKAETDRATGRPWAAMVNGQYHDAQRGFVTTILADGRVAEAYDSTEAGSANRAALIVERVNGWDELVAERDALKAKVAGLYDELGGHMHDEDVLRAERDRLQAAANEMEIALLSALSQVDAGCTQAAGEVIRASIANVALMRFHAMKRLGLVEESSEP